jgi:iron(III) transport system substrate-binding protein
MVNMNRRQFLTASAAAVAAAGLTACGSTSSSDSGSDAGSSSGGELSGDLVIYSSAPEADNNSILDGFGSMYPDLNIEIIEGNQGEGIARLQAEADNPTVDVVYTGINNSDGDLYKDLFEAYVSPENENLEEQYQSNGFYNYNMISTCCICVNTDLEDELGIEIKGYEDLTDSALEGVFIMSDPTESSSAWNNVCNIFADYGYDSDESWDLIKRLLQNKMIITDSSSTCFNNVQAGEYVAGITYEGGPIELLGNGAENIRIVYPEEGTGGFLFASAVVKGAPHMDNAKALVDWLTSFDGQQSQIDNGSPQRHIATGLDFSDSIVPELDQELVARDVDWLIENKQAMLDKWTEYYTEYYNG